MSDDFGALRNRILDELDRSDMTSQVEAEIRTAIKHYETERFWFNEDQTTTVTAPGVATLAVPADMLELDTLHIERNGHPMPPLDRKTWDWYRNLGGDDTNVGRSVPSSVVEYAGTFHLYPVPDATYTAVVSFLAQFDELTASANTNAWCVEGEEMIRQRAKASFRINYENDGGAKQEAGLFAQRGERFLSGVEKIAYGQLKRLTSKRVGSGKIVPMRF